MRNFFPPFGISHCPFYFVFLFGDLRFYLPKVSIKNNLMKYDNYPFHGCLDNNNIFSSFVRKYLPGPDLSHFSLLLFTHLSWVCLSKVIMSGRETSFKCEGTYHKYGQRTPKTTKPQSIRQTDSRREGGEILHL